MSKLWEIMSEDDRDVFKEVFYYNKYRLVYERYLAEDLYPLIESVQVHGYIYKRIKDIEAGKYMKFVCDTRKLLPPFIKQKGVKEGLKYAYRWRFLLREQTRIRYWVKRLGWSKENVVRLMIERKGSPRKQKTDCLNYGKGSRKKVLRNHVYRIYMERYRSWLHVSKEDFGNDFSRFRKSVASAPEIKYYALTCKVKRGRKTRVVAGESLKHAVARLCRYLNCSFKVIGVRNVPMDKMDEKTEFI
jgi:hypothetical protein